MAHHRVHVLTRLGPAVIAGLLAGAPTLGQEAGMARAFAHNDYRHGHPLLDALQRGFNAVEADVHLLQGRLLVGHDSTDLRPERTLEVLYLDPLRTWVGEHGARAQRTGSPMLLLVDVKTEAQPTYAPVSAVLRPAPPRAAPRSAASRHETCNISSSNRLTDSERRADGGQAA